MANVAYKFAGNVRDQVMHPMTIAYDTGFGLLGTVLIDTVGFDNVIGNLADSVNLSPQRTNQLAAGLTFATLSAMERATIATLGKAY